MDFTAALPVFFITLREGVEAALVVGIVLACLAKANASHLNRSVYQGIFAGLAVSVLVGCGVGLAFQVLGMSSWLYASVLKQVLQGAIALIAIVLLSWMLIWMTQQAKGLKQEVEASVQSALAPSGSTKNSAWGVFSLIFVAVLREGVETVLFLGAQLQQGWIPALGAVLGLVGATVIGLLIFKGGVRLNLRQFFQSMGVLLLLIVGGLVITALRKAEATALLLSQINPDFAALCASNHASCLLGPQVWNLSGVLPDARFPGLLLKALFGYTQSLYLVQAIAYVSFLLLVGRRYWQSLNPS